MATIYRIENHPIFIQRIIITADEACGFMNLTNIKKLSRYIYIFFKKLYDVYTVFVGEIGLVKHEFFFPLIKLLINSIIS